MLLRSRRRERKCGPRRATRQRKPTPRAATAEREASVRSELQLVRATLVDMKPQYAETVFLHDVLGTSWPNRADDARVGGGAQSRLCAAAKICTSAWP